MREKFRDLANRTMSPESQQRAKERADAMMTDPASTLRALASEALNTIAAEVIEWRSVTRVTAALNDFAGRVQALQREADAQQLTAAAERNIAHGEAISDLMFQKKQLEAKLAAHASLVQEMETYLQHRPTCPLSAYVAGGSFNCGCEIWESCKTCRRELTDADCTCGLATLLRRSPTL